MLLSDIEKHYKTEYFKEQDCYLLYSLNPGDSRFVYKYYCPLRKSLSGSFYVERYSPTTDLNVLIKQVSSYVGSLPYDSDYYNPRMVVGFTENFIIHDYLVDTLKFKSKGDSVYAYEPKNIYLSNSYKLTIYLSGLDPWESLYKIPRPTSSVLKNKKISKKAVPFIYKKEHLSENVTIKLYTGRYSWVETTVKREVEDIKTGIDSLLKPLLIADSIETFQASDKMKNENLSDIDLFLKSFDTKTLVMSDLNYKNLLKAKLESVLATLA